MGKEISIYSVLGVFVPFALLLLWAIAEAFRRDLMAKWRLVVTFVIFLVLSLMALGLLLSESGYKLRFGPTPPDIPPPREART